MKNRPAMQKRIKRLNVDMEWLNHNLNQVSGVASSMIQLDSDRRISILGKKTFIQSYVNESNGVKSPFSKTIDYMLDTEEHIHKLKSDIEQRLIKLNSKLE